MRGRGLVIDVAGVDVGAVIEQVRRDLDRRREMERGLAVAATGVDKLRVALDQLAESVHAGKARRGVDVDHGPALDRVVRQLGRNPVEQTKAAGPPAALGVKVGTGGDERVDHLAAAGAVDEG